MTLGGAALRALAAFVAGAVNAVAGGGTKVAQRLPPAGMRGVAIAVGLHAAGRFLWR